MARKVWILTSRRMYTYILAIIALCTIITGVWMNRSVLPVFSTEEGPSAFYRADIDEKKTALTFNISWGEDRALPILDTLKEKEVEAAFFVSGAWAERHPDIMERMMEDGHTIGSHGYRYEHYPNMDKDEIIRDLNLSHKKINDVTGIDVEYFRPPHGDFTPSVLETISTFGYTTVHWSVGGNDWENPGVNQIVSDVTGAMQPGDVIMLHASDSAEQTGEALPEIIEDVREKGYTFASLDELISQAETDVEELASP
ncbi:polysaccharide deacetylase family sporulation protein PdaB [Salibacterium halotolerans]|uniref:Polysaccharide deacetylase family sporulation protein PdaB n=1 Tax=Salibacterium halotolerans TaxID=1884432 RepID=A0A1I5WHB9_9BACI|nr:polysaccharide deacetylase family sporulation protein PdaB [Salibacterium halotolerans]SFQ19090.1 polysaccharide deacetylase family sporulation protein PdaB [Salibacterium halotolerans]